MSDLTLTGRRRHRTQRRLFRAPVLVLQVEVAGLVTTYSSGFVDCEKRRWWIDAKVEHLTTLAGES